MFGGPWLGIIVFVVIAIGLGWGLTMLFRGMIDHTHQITSESDFDHGFDADKPYTLKRDLVLGFRVGGDDVALVPFKEDLPRGAPGRYTWPTATQFAEDPEGFKKSHALIGAVAAGTQVQFVEVIDDRDNQQTRVLVMTRLLNGPYARKTAVLGLHLESVDSDAEATRYVPRPDLFEIVEIETGPVQSEPEPPTDESP